MARTRRKVNLSDINDPKGITLTKSPANQTGFKVIRSTEETKDDSPLRSIVMSEDATTDMAKALVEAYKLADCDIVEKDGSITVRQTSYVEGETVVPVGIGNGNTAMIASSVFAEVSTHAPVARTADAKVAISKQPVLASLAFSSDQYPNAKAVCDWLDTNKISYGEGSVVQSDDGYLVTRSDAPSAESGSVTFAEGVTGKVARGNELDVPESVYRMVAEQVYGYYADWEYIDFAVAMANPDYTSKSEDALWVLRDVLENITLYSTLDNETRKVLIRQATDSYAEYMITMLDSLPTPVTTQERSDKSSIPEISQMTDTKVEAKETDEVARSEDTAVETPAEESPLTRSDIEGIVQAAFDAHDAKRSDEAKPEDVAEVAERSDDKVDPLTLIAETLTAMATRMDAMDVAVETAAKVAVEQEDSVTVTRSEEETTEEVQRSENVSPFVGMFGDRLQA